MDKNIYILGVDGGGSSTVGYLFNQNGEVVCEAVVPGTNLASYAELAIDRLVDLINILSNNSKLALDEISAFGFGLAGISDLNQKDMFLKKLDQINILSRSKIYSDSDIAFHLLCPEGMGILICVGTGVVCIAKDSKGKKYTIAGKGHDEDIGSGYWIGKQAIERTLLNQTVISADKDLSQIYSIILKNTNSTNFNDLSEIIFNTQDSISMIASIAKEIIEIADNGNDIALSIIQEGTRYIGDYIILMLQKLNQSNNTLVISGHGSILKNIFFRKLLNQSLEFEVNNLQWIFSDISPAFSAGIMAAKSKKIEVSIEDIVQNIKK